MRAATPTKKASIPSPDSQPVHVRQAPSSTNNTTASTPASVLRTNASRVLPAPAAASAPPRKPSNNGLSGVVGSRPASTLSLGNSGGLVGSVRLGSVNVAASTSALAGKDYGCGGMGIFTPVELKKPSASPASTNPSIENNRSAILSATANAIRRNPLQEVLSQTTSQSDYAKKPADEDGAAQRFQAAWRGFVARKQVLENLHNQIVQLSATVAAREAELAAVHAAQLAAIDRATASLRLQSLSSISELEPRIQEQEMQEEFLDTDLKKAALAPGSTTSSRHSSTHNNSNTSTANDFDAVRAFNGEEVLAGVMNWDDDVETKMSDKSLGSAHSLLGSGSVGTSSVNGLAVTPATSTANNSTGSRNIWGPIGSEVSSASAAASVANTIPIFGSPSSASSTVLTSSGASTTVLTPHTSITFKHPNGLPTPLSAIDQYNTSQLSSASESFYSSSSSKSSLTSTPPLDGTAVLPISSAHSIISSSTTTSSTPLASVKSIWENPSAFEDHSIRNDSASIARYPSRRASFGSNTASAADTRRGGSNIDFIAARDEGRRATFDPNTSIVDDREALIAAGLEVSGPISYHQLVDKIIRINDQPASLLLQQKLKSSDPAIRDAIFEAILREPLSLMRNRFGNFLMQRCLEYGSAQQIRMIGETLRGNVLSLSCDRFGCHVVQKALDTVSEPLKHVLVNELLPHATSTILHRFACHVWQRALEIKWTNCEAPPIMRAAHAAVKGRWHMVAADESGSLVVQCVFERRGEEEKAPVMGEVLARAVEVSKGQWGNWVIQHILEHGAPADRSYLLRVVARNLKEMAADQYASKVVEKAMRVAPRRELSEMVEACISCNGGRDGGRPPLLDMMNHQYANYVVQHLLQLADHNGREACARVLAPHLSTLRGSKYGQRVATLVEKVLRGRCAIPGASVAPPIGLANCGTATNGIAINNNTSRFSATTSIVSLSPSLLPQGIQHFDVNNCNFGANNSNASQPQQMHQLLAQQHLMMQAQQLVSPSSLMPLGNGSNSHMPLAQNVMAPIGSQPSVLYHNNIVANINANTIVS
ncbi:hypothetical protein SeMB42_g06744 [Synchytrium endobioticum]|uniref:PUM-HD domain-containing protein n=1 Tax=Synchytrium endobioticum TaxID=286115 RepID=A0A507C9R1_9FUNG|nr:hypothetical protein SeLEV6574_g07860 [Synchytrium endobioticum]TPX38426.1 hypothetical protein SeMB42_g06744 [Synchytrium endobioticum]